MRRRAPPSRDAPAPETVDERQGLARALRDLRVPLHDFVEWRLAVDGVFEIRHGHPEQLQDPSGLLARHLSAPQSTSGGAAPLPPTPPTCHSRRPRPEPGCAGKARARSAAPSTLAHAAPLPPTPPPGHSPRPRPLPGCAGNAPARSAAPPSPPPYRPSFRPSGP